jgi:putative transposase
MPTEHDPHHRKQVRLVPYDYTLPGGYFVTLVTHHRAPLFGEILDGEMHLNELGAIVLKEWQRSANIRREIDIDEFVIMPNHIHGIVFIHETDAVGAHGRAPQQNIDHTGTAYRKPRSLGSFVAGFKAACTTKINSHRNTPGKPVWQRNYYEHVIRNEKDLDQIRQYILDNPAKWKLDEEYPAQGIQQEA